jgi:hypothetical protein
VIRLLALEKLILILLIHLILYTSKLVLQMIFKLSGPIELTSAVITAKFPIFVMSPHMIFQVPFGDKVLGADLALIVAMAIVRLQMHVEVAFLCEFVSAEVAAVGLDT